MNPGNIILLKRRKFKHVFDIRFYLSYLIAYFTKTSNQLLDDVVVHCAIIYQSNNETFVRDMDKKGNEPYTINQYRKIYGNRMEIKINPHNLYNEILIKKFSDECENLDVKYDYFNLLFFQLIKSMFHKFIGKETKTKRICSEDVARIYNVLNPYFFLKPEEITPNELSEYISYWKTLKTEEL